MDENEILNVYELMETLRVGKNFAYQLLSSGEIKAFRVGRTWKIPKRVVDDFIMSSALERKCY